MRVVSRVGRKYAEKVAMSEGTIRKKAFLGPHDDCELELMLAGKKHLSFFFFETEAAFPKEIEFDAHVDRGFLVKDECVEHFISPEDGQETSARNILYATASEAWRIPAMRMIQAIYRRMGPGWRPDLERAVGSLLGYDPEDVEAFIENLVKRPG